MVSVQEQRSEQEALAAMMGVSVEALTPPPKNDLQRVCARCANCRKWLLEPMRARCKACGTIVCRCDKRCHVAHVRVHLQERANEKAQAMSKRRLAQRPAVSMETFEKLLAAGNGMNITMMDESAEITPEQHAAMLEAVTKE